MYILKSQNGLGFTWPVFSIARSKITRLLRPELEAREVAPVTMPAHEYLTAAIDLSNPEFVAKVAAGHTSLSPSSIAGLSLSQAIAAGRWALSNWGLRSPDQEKFQASMSRYVWPRLKKEGLLPTPPSMPTRTTSDVADRPEIPDIGITEGAVVGGEIPTFVEAASGEQRPWLKWGLLALGGYILYDSFVKSERKRPRRRKRRYRMR